MNPEILIQEILARAGAILLFSWLAAYSIIRHQENPGHPQWMAAAIASLLFGLVAAIEVGTK